MIEFVYVRDLIRRVNFNQITPRRWFDDNKIGFCQLNAAIRCRMTIDHIIKHRSFLSKRRPTNIHPRTFYIQLNGAHK